MLKDPTEFRKRFAAWKDGKPAYKDGRPVLVNGNPTNALFNSDGTFTDDITKVFDDFYVTPSGVTTKYGSYTDKNWDRYKQLESFYKYRDLLTGKLKGEPGLEIVSPEYDILTLGAGARTNAATQVFLKNRKIANAIAKGIKENAVITGYNRNPVTKELGTLWDYQSYLDNVFPNSKIKDVLWHGSIKKDLLSFSPEYIGSNMPIKKSVGMYLAPEKTTAANYGRKGDIYPVLLNTENPFVTNQFFGGISKNGINITKISPKTKSTILANNDAVIAPTRGEIAFFEPNNALILGSKRDVEGFREFMSKPSIVSPRIELNIDRTVIKGSGPYYAAENLKKYIANAILSKPQTDKIDFFAEKPTFLLYKGIYDMPVSDEIRQIYSNSILPRLQFMRPGYHGGVMRPTVKSHVEHALNRGYTVYPEQVFNDAGEPLSVAGLHYSDTGHIAIKEGEQNFAIGHELRHRLDRTLKLTDDEMDILLDAYDPSFSVLNQTDESLKHVANMNKEMVTTNFDTREKLLGSYHLRNTPVNLLNKIIDKSTDLLIFDALENANGYGLAYIKQLRSDHKLTPEFANAMRKALKYVGGASIPSIFTYNTYK